ncbi:MAG: acyl-CoA dehydrogenase family protein [Pseudomonadota bacterium]
MEFGLSDDQRMFQDSIKGYLESAAALDEIRNVAEGDVKKSRAMSAGVAELGVTQVLIPERYGGLGLGLLDAALIQEAFGAAVAPVDHLATAMAIVGIESAGTEAEKTEWLTQIATGQVRMGVAVAESVGAREDAGVTAARGRLSGNSLFALESQNATHILVADADGRLHMAARGDAIQRRAHLTIDRTRDLAELVFNNAPAVTLNGENTPGSAVDRVIEAGRLLLAADTLGAAQAMLDKAVEYAKERKQFNRVIGSFQSVKHLCAEMAAQLEPARALVWHAAHAVDETMDDGALMVCLAKSHLSEVGTFIARTSTEVHGGMGFTDLVGLHYWFKRIGTNRQLLGGPEKVREDAARLQGWAKV